MADVILRMENGQVSYRGRSLSLSQPNAVVGLWTGRGGLSQDRVDKILKRHELAAGEKSARVALELVRKEIPRRTGRTARTFDISTDASGERRHWSVGSGDDNAIRLHEGTGLYGPRHHRIFPTHGRVFRFPARETGGFRLDGTVRIRRGLPHPGARYVYAPSIRGMQSDNYLERAAIEARPLIIRIHKDAARAAAMELRLR